MHLFLNKPQSNRIARFKKWKHKQFAVFSSLHRVVHIGFLNVAYLLFALPANAADLTHLVQADTARSVREVQVDEVLVTGQRAPVSFSEAARVVNVIDRKAIQSAPIQSLQDLLEYAFNVDLRQRGGLGVQADLSIRGSSFDQVLVLLNGANINDPQTGHHNLNLPVSLDAIDRIEILEGPASRVYGPNAFSGVVNIITGTQDPNLKVKLSSGEHGYFDTGASTTVKTGNLTNLISADYRKSDGYLNNTDFKLFDGYYLGKLDTRAGDLSFQLGYTERGFGANSFYTPAYPNQYEQTKTTFASVKMETGKVVHFTPTIYWRRNQDRFELFRDNQNAPSWYKEHNYHLTDVYGTNLNAWFSTGWGKSAFGVDFRNENVWSNVLGNPLVTPIAVPGEPGHFFTKSDSRTNFSLYAEQSVFVNRFSLSAGLMANYNSHLGMDWTLFPGADVSYRLANPLKWYASFNTSLRIPTFTDLYYKSATTLGDPNLKPEKAEAYETGFKLQYKGFDSHVAYFHRNGHNMIDYVKLPNEAVWQARNLTNIQTNGVEFSGKILPGQLLGHPFFVNALSFGYSWLGQNKDAGAYASKYVLDFLKQKIDIGLNHKVIRNVSVNWQASYQDRNGTYTKWEGSSFGKEVPYAPFWLVDARITYNRHGMTLYAEAANLLNKTYYDLANVPEPGRWLRFGLSYQLFWANN